MVIFYHSISLIIDSPHKPFLTYCLKSSWSSQHFPNWNRKDEKGKSIERRKPLNNSWKEKFWVTGNICLFKSLYKKRCFSERILPLCFYTGRNCCLFLKQHLFSAGLINTASPHTLLLWSSKTCSAFPMYTLCESLSTNNKLFDAKSLFNIIKTILVAFPGRIFILIFPHKNGN